MFMTSSFVIASSQSPIPKREQVIEAERKIRLLKPKTIFELLTSNIYVLAFVAYGTWILLGILFYHFYDKYTLATAYFYTLEAGLSVGFCNPVEVDDNSRMFTIIFVVLGGLIASGILGVFATSLLASRAILVPVGHKLGAVSIRNDDGQITLKSFCSGAWYNIKYCCGWYTSRSKTILTLLCLTWIALGTIYCVLYEQWSVISSLYWSVITMSTGGLQSPPCVSGSGTTCNIGNFRGAMMGTFMLIGIPIYAATLAEWAKLGVTKVLQKRQENLLNQPIEDAEFLFAANILSPEGSETLVLGEYILLELMRMGLTNQAQIESIKRKFYDLDKDKSGELDIEDLRQVGVVVPRKIHSVESKRRRPTRSMELMDITQLIRTFTPTKRREGNSSTKQKLSEDSATTATHPAGSKRTFQKKKHKAEEEVEEMTMMTPHRDIMHFEDFEFNIDDMEEGLDRNKSTEHEDEKVIEEEDHACQHLTLRKPSPTTSDEL